MSQVLLQDVQGLYRVSQVLIWDVQGTRHPRSQGRHMQCFYRVSHILGVGCTEIIGRPRSWSSFDRVSGL